MEEETRPTRPCYPDRRSSPGPDGRRNGATALYRGRTTPYPLTRPSLSVTVDRAPMSRDRPTGPGTEPGCHAGGGNLPRKREGSTYDGSVPRTPSSPPDRMCGTRSTGSTPRPEVGSRVPDP